MFKISLELFICVLAQLFVIGIYRLNTGNIPLLTLFTFGFSLGLYFSECMHKIIFQTYL